MYLFQSRQTTKVTKSWQEVQELVLRFPYCVFRKFDTADAAWDYASRHKWKTSSEQGIYNFGNMLPRLSLTISTMIMSDHVIYNIIQPRSFDMYINLKPGVEVLYSGRNISIKDSTLKLEPNLPSSLAIALCNILNLVGSYACVELILPDMSSFYMFKAKKLENKAYTRLQDIVSSRLGETGLTVATKQYKKLGGIV